MSKEQTIAAIRETGIVAVIRADGEAELLDTTVALNQGGVKALELTMTSPGALDVLKEVSRRLTGEAILGIGSVLDAETARLAILAGAQFVVSPILNYDIITMCQRYSIPCIPGAFTPTEILNAWQAGADVVKVFPATKLGPGYLKDIKGPLPQVKLTPTGGINLENTGDFIRAGAEFVGVGGALVNKELIKSKNWTALSSLATQFIDEVRKARL
ncbi:MAG TPA: bifunctional 4-hydroxy-2-oxoglutarate aldolase/2-dehydro-3-deoxy-phosphogluconate aldolase [Firmicutes bacterium]|nr:bifunctional 4-hydroxy-2-oxoglutarate aldolase/2-dehydro-3-deoxy-phosphogluconate aldolase [Bacillota bacterium]